MTSARPSRPIVTRFRLALLLSVILHGLLAVPCLVLSVTLTRPERTPWLDTRTGPPLSGQWVALSPPRPMPEPRGAETPPAPAGSSTVARPAKAATIPAAPTGFTGTGSTASFGSAVGGNGGSASGMGNPRFFEIAGEGRTIVYVIDRSASMGQSGSFAAAKRELLASLRELPPTTRFQVIVYNRRAEPLVIHGRTDLVPATAENKQAAARLIEALSSEGSTEHATALKRALSLRPDIIYFVTDADDLRPEQIRALTVLNHGQAAIHAIELGQHGRARDSKSLQALASQNKGVYRQVR